MAVVWNIRRPVASLLPSLASSSPSSSCVASCTSASSERLTWRALRATSDMPFFWWSSSSSVIIGRKMSCSSKRNSELGSCSSTFVSRTNSLRGSFWARGLARLVGLDAALAGRAGVLAAGAGAGGGTWRAGAGICALRAGAVMPSSSGCMSSSSSSSASTAWALDCAAAVLVVRACARAVSPEGKVRMAAGRVGNFGSGICVTLQGGPAIAPDGCSGTANRCFLRPAGLPWRGPGPSPRATPAPARHRRRSKRCCAQCLAPACHTYSSA
ncbi:hypothetical protein D3C85_466690 [compost metagenome]